MHTRGPNLWMTCHPWVRQVPLNLIEYELSSADFFAEAQWVIYVAGYLVVVFDNFYFVFDLGFAYSRTVDFLPYTRTRTVYESYTISYISYTFPYIMNEICLEFCIWLLRDCRETLNSLLCPPGYPDLVKRFMVLYFLKNIFFLDHQYYDFVFCSHWILYRVLFLSDINLYHNRS
jgi:hypothetical protein